jgi:hypothetical protein
VSRHRPNGASTVHHELLESRCRPPRDNHIAGHRILRQHLRHEHAVAPSAERHGGFAVFEIIDPYRKVASIDKAQQDLLEEHGYTMTLGSSPEYYSDNSDYTACVIEDGNTRFY